MSRDVKRYKVFVLADALVVDVYKLTRGFPSDERFGLSSQLRRAAVSVPTNLVEGAYRRSDAEFARFIEVALGSAAEVRYLLSVAERVMTTDDATALQAQYDELVRGLAGLLSAVKEGRQS